MKKNEKKTRTVPVLSGSEVMAADKRAIRAGTPGRTLMKRAAKGLAEFIDSLDAKRVVFVTGPGNNGADGITASGLIRKSTEVEIFCVFPREKVNSSFLWAQSISGQGVVFMPSSSALKESLRRADCVVDGIFGTGFHGIPGGRAASAIKLINASKRLVVACDVPSGIDSDTGKAGLAVNADFSVTFGFPKKGLFLGRGAEISGSVRVVDIGLKKTDRKTVAGMIAPRDIGSKIPARSSKSHKYTSGHVLIFAGAMKGAASLAALGALRGGAGLVTIAGELKNFPEAIILDDDADFEKYIKEKKVRAIVFGPGFGRKSALRAVDVLEIFSKTDVPKVIDADGIFLAKKYGYLKKLKNCVFTPHTGEARILTRGALAAPGSWNTVKKLSASLGAVVVLKGHRTVISEGKTVMINPTGNPVLASGGTGDLLAGITAGLIAGGMDVFSGALAAVYAHGLAADLFMKKNGNAGALIRDIASLLPRAMKIMKEGRLA
ncbi:MAG: NAD(P)H-hydrate dehydratase [Elusimicrobiota bacterium]|nr:NAD(P)H-hydrate dehydratase [Elusimicrobiota bacterium]